MRRWTRRIAVESLSVAATLLMAAEATRKIMTKEIMTADTKKKMMMTMIIGTVPLRAIRTTAEDFDTDEDYLLSKRIEC